MKDDPNIPTLGKKPEPSEIKIEPGTVVYFTKAKTKPGLKTPEWGFKGHGYGIMLGLVPPGTLPPPLDFIKYQMANVGFVGFDEIAEFLGKEVAETCVKKAIEKYSRLFGVPVAAEAPPGITPAGITPLDIPPPEAG